MFGGVGREGAGVDLGEHLLFVVQEQHAETAHLFLLLSLTDGDLEEVPELETQHHLDYLDDELDNGEHQHRYVGLVVIELGTLGHEVEVEGATGQEGQGAGHVVNDHVASVDAVEDLGNETVTQDVGDDTLGGMRG